MEIIVYGPKTPEDLKELQHRIAKIHAQFVLHYVEKLNCPLEQKLKLMDAVAETFRKRGIEEEKA